MNTTRSSKSAIKTLNLRLAALDAEIEEIFASDRSPFVKNRSPFVKNAMFMAVLATRTAVAKRLAA